MPLLQARNNRTYLVASHASALAFFLICGLTHLRPPLSAQTAQTGAATVRGVVRNPLGYGAPGVTVWIHNRPKGAAEPPKPLSRWVRTSIRGEFTFSQIPDGRYVLCAELPNSEYLSTCAWETPETFTIGGKAGEVATPTIQLRRGKLLLISIPDPKGTRHWKNWKEIEEQFQFTVDTAAGQSLPMRLRHVAPYSLEYALLVPPEKALRLHGVAKNARFGSTVLGTAQDRRSFSQATVVRRAQKPFVLTIPMEGVSLPRLKP